MSQVVVRWIDAEGELQVGGEGDLDRARQTGAAWAWADVTDPSPEALSRICDHFGFHELAIEDAQHPQARVKVDRYPEGLFLVWLTPERPHSDGITVSELDAFIGAKYLVTLHTGPNKAIDAVAADALRTMPAGPAWVLHKVIDLLVDNTLPLVDKIGERLSAIEDKMLGNPRQEDLRDLHRFRRQLVRLHRILAPERDLLRGLARESDVISEEAYRYFQDVGDHVARALDTVETYMDVGASVMDVYLSAQSNRMNEIMKQLTVVATIFMPLTLISGIYGMNLIGGMWPPAGERFWPFWMVMGFMLVLAVAMAAYFRKKNWW